MTAAGTQSIFQFIICSDIIIFFFLGGTIRGTRILMVSEGGFVNRRHLRIEHVSAKWPVSL